MDKQKVSVIIPVYNCGQYIKAAIKSVLDQTYHPYEIIVVDDGSIDNSAEVVKNLFPNVKYHFQKNRGAASARNKGIDLAAGDLLAFLDADDVWSKDKLQIQMAAFNRDPLLDMVFGGVRVIDIISGSKREIMNGYLVGTMMVKHRFFARVGPFSTNWDVGEFIEWYSRAQELGAKSNMLPQIVLERRIHGNNLGIRMYEARGDYVRIIKTSLDRRRKNNLT